MVQKFIHFNIFNYFANYSLPERLGCKVNVKYICSFLNKVSVQGVKSLGSHFACLCRGFEFYEVNFFFIIIFQKENGTFNNFYSEKSAKRAH